MVAFLFGETVLVSLNRNAIIYYSIQITNIHVMYPISTGGIVEIDNIIAMFQPTKDLRFSFKFYYRFDKYYVKCFLSLSLSLYTLIV